MTYDFSEDLDIKYTFDENYVLINYLGIDMIYSVKDDKINATKLCKQFDRDFNKFNETKGGKLLKEKFPDKFKIVNKIKNELSGTYIDTELINVVICWANPLIGYYVSNGYVIPDDVIKTSNDARLNGYIYIVQPEEYLNTNIIKIGRTWNPDIRIPKYGKNTNVLFLKEVNNMYETERNILYYIDTYEYKLVKDTKEYIELEEDETLEDFIKFIKSNVKELAD